MRIEGTAKREKIWRFFIDKRRPNPVVVEDFDIKSRAHMGWYVPPPFCTRIDSGKKWNLPVCPAVDKNLVSKFLSQEVASDIGLINK